MLELIGKLATAMRGGTREVLETAVDANALRILAQEIYECEGSLRQAKQQLAQIMAEKLRLQRQLDAQRQILTDKENRIRTLLATNDETAALSLAEEVANQESLISSGQRQHDQLQAYEQRLLASLKSNVSQLEQYRAEWRMAQATRHAQQAVGKLSVHANSHGDKFAQIQSSLERIRHHHETFDDQMQAMQQIDATLKGTAEVNGQNKAKAAEVLIRLRATV